MSVEAISAVKYVDCPTASTKLVLFVLANYADERGSCYPSEAHLGRICGLSARQIRRCIKTLEKMDVIRTESRLGTSNRYFLTVDAGVRGSADTHGRGVLSRVSPNTKEKQKKQRRSLNDIAG